MSICPNCSQATVSGVAHCAFCGKALSEVSDTSQRSSASAARDYWLGVLLVAVPGAVWVIIQLVLSAGGLPASGDLTPPIILGRLSLGVAGYSVPVTIASGILWLVLRLTLGRRKPDLVRGVHRSFVALLFLELGALAVCTVSGIAAWVFFAHTAPHHP